MISGGFNSFCALFISINQWLYLHGMLMLVGIKPVLFISGGSRTSISKTSGLFGRFSISSSVAKLIFDVSFLCLFLPLYAITCQC